MGQTRQEPGYENRRPWNVGRFVGAKRPLTTKQLWKVRFHPERDQRMRHIASGDDGFVPAARRNPSLRNRPLLSGTWLD